MKATDDIKVVAEKFRNTPHRTVLVADPTTDKLAGLITSKDLTKLAEKSSGVAKDIASSGNVVAIRNDAQVWQLLKIMNGENALGRPLDTLPVVDADGKPQGVVKRDTLRGITLNLPTAQ